jgi:hypothetical protein
LFYDSILNMKGISQELGSISRSGPTVVLLLHGPFNNIVTQVFFEGVVKPNVIARSLRKGEGSDPRWLLFQENKSSRLTAFAMAFKHLQREAGSILLAPDGATGSKRVAVSLFGEKRPLYAGASFLSHGTNARTCLMYPVFKPQGIELRIADLAIPTTSMKADEYERVWVEKCGRAIEQSLSDLDSVPSLTLLLMRGG